MQLVRFPAVFTAMADILLGFLLTHSRLEPWHEFALLLAASSLLYLSGMVLNDYFEDQRSILITTHEVREIEHILTDVVFIHRGRTLLSLSMDQLSVEFAKVTAGTDELEALRELQPLSERKSLQGTDCIFRGADRAALAQHGAVATPNLAELFVAVIGDQS